MQSFISKSETIARGVTDVGVGSSALLGFWGDKLTERDVVPVEVGDSKFANAVWLVVNIVVNRGSSSSKLRK